jgi:hypothetical protein
MRASVEFRPLLVSSNSRPSNPKIQGKFLGVGHGQEHFQLREVEAQSSLQNHKLTHTIHDCKRRGICMIIAGI